MRKLILIFLVSLLIALGRSELYGGQDIPLNLLVFHKIIKEYGYTSVPMDEPNMLGYAQPGSFVFVALDNVGNITGGMVALLARHKEAPYYALGTIYAILQYRLGKPLDKNAARRKGLYLHETIKYNLKLMDKTMFTYDDMIVIATKDKDIPSITITLTLR